MTRNESIKEVRARLDELRLLVNLPGDVPLPVCAACRRAARENVACAVCGRIFHASCLEDGDICRDCTGLTQPDERALERVKAPLTSVPSSLSAAPHVAAVSSDRRRGYDEPFPFQDTKRRSVITPDKRLITPDKIVVTLEKDGSELLFVPAGEFEMGEGGKSDEPKHTVYLDAYYVAKYCVTNAQYAEFARATGFRSQVNERLQEAGLENHPVVNISWNDAVAYAKWAGCELPTEAQWEKAARGPQGYVYPWGNEWYPDKLRHFGNRGSGTTAPVDAYPGGTSGYGTYQQAGNVCEWCSDWYREDYYKSPEGARNPEGASRGSGRVIRGGSWRLDGPQHFRGAGRSSFDPSFRNDTLGFRLARRA